MSLTRREFGKLAIATWPTAGLWLRSTGLMVAAKPNSKWAGVHVGMNVPYNFGEGNYISGDEILRRCVQLNISAVELRMQPVELFMGSPEAISAAARGRATAAARAANPPTTVQDPSAAAAPQAPRAGGAPRGGRAALTPEQEAAQKAAADDLHKWRLSAPMTKVAEFKKLYDDAGVAVEIVKIDGIFGFTDDVLDYTFGLAKTLGARALSTEITTAPQEADRAAQFKRLGQFAEKHKMMIGYHGHTATSPKHWEEAFAVGKYNGANLDIGHFLSGNKTSPLPFLKQYHDRITHIHVKDKTVNDKNVEFGTGDTPIKEALQTIRDNKWNIQATIEFEIPGPAGPDGRPRAWTMDERMQEMARCVQYCKTCLLG
jgi:sugar phosphate isomerase/epimerase